MRLVLESCKVNISLYQPARIFFFFPLQNLKSLYRHLDRIQSHPNGLDNTLLSQGCDLEAATRMGCDLEAATRR